MPRPSVPVAFLSLHLLLASCASSDWTRLGHDLDAMIEDTAGGTTQVAARIVSLSTGRILYDRHAKRLLHPASTMKLVTVAAALRHGLAESVIHTSLRGATDARGPLYLRGGGDPFLTSDELQGMVDTLRGRGVEMVSGPLVVDEALFAGPRFGFGWMWDDEPACFMPHISSLTVERGCVEVRVDADIIDEEGRPRVSIFPRSEHLRVVNRATVDSGPPAPSASINIDRDWQGAGRTITVRGSIRPGESVTRRLSVPLPGLFAGRVLKAHLVEQGLATEQLEVVPLSRQPGTSSGTIGGELARVERPVPAVVKRLLKDSDNLAAECLLRLLVVQLGIRPADGPRGVSIVNDYVRELGLEPGAYRLVDGSGLSHLNLVSAELLVAVLVDMRRRSRTSELFEAALPVAAVDGTLRRRMRETPAAGHLRAKTGTLSGVSALAGYAETADGEPVAFAFLMQNFVGSSRPWRDLQDRLAVRLVAARRD